jgi:hypothetical protein
MYTNMEEMELYFCWDQTTEGYLTLNTREECEGGKRFAREDNKCEGLEGAEKLQ